MRRTTVLLSGLVIASIGRTAFGQARGWIHLSSGDSLPILNVGRYALWQSPSHVQAGA
jgi:hypothetical protein